MSTTVHNPRQSGPRPAKKTPCMHARARIGIALFIFAQAFFGVAAIGYSINTGAYWPLFLAGVFYWLCAAIVSP